jgi:hypothetical protein
MSRPRSRALIAGLSSLLATSVAIADTAAATTTTEPEPGAVEILPSDEAFGGRRSANGVPAGGSGR